MKKLHAIQANMQDDFQSLRSSGMRSSAFSQHSNGQQMVKGEKFNVPPENTNATYGWTKRQLFMSEKEKTLELHQRLDNKFDTFIAKEV